VATFSKTNFKQIKERAYSLSKGLVSGTLATKSKSIKLKWSNTKLLAIPQYQLCLGYAWTSNVYEWSDMSTRGLLFQTTTIIKMQLNVLVYYKKDRLKSKWYSWNFVELNNNHSLLYYCTNWSYYNVWLPVI